MSPTFRMAFRDACSLKFIYGHLPASLLRESVDLAIFRGGRIWDFLHRRLCYMQRHNIISFPNCITFIAISNLHKFLLIF